MSVEISNDGPRLYITADLYITMEEPQDRLIPQLQSSADKSGADGTALVLVLP
jgi:hypothetical protein